MSDCSVQYPSENMNTGGKAKCSEDIFINEMVSSSHMLPFLCACEEVHTVLITPNLTAVLACAQARQ